MITPDTAAIRDLIADTEVPDTTGLTEEQARIVTCDRNRRVKEKAHEWRAQTLALLAENERLQTVIDNLRHLEKKHRDTTNDQFHRANRLQAEIERLRAAMKD